MLEPEVVKAVLPPAAFAAGGGIIRLVLQYLMFPGGRKHRPWFGDLLYAVLRGPTVLWCAAAGLFLALEVLDIEGRLALGVRHTLFVLIVLSISWPGGGLTGASARFFSLPPRRPRARLRPDARRVDHPADVRRLRHAGAHGAGDRRPRDRPRAPGYARQFLRRNSHPLLAPRAAGRLRAARERRGGLHSGRHVALHDDPAAVRQSHDRAEREARHHDADQLLPAGDGDRGARAAGNSWS